MLLLREYQVCLYKAAAAASAVRFLRREGTGHPVGGISAWLTAGFAKGEETGDDDLTGAGGGTREEKEAAKKKE